MFLCDVKTRVVSREFSSGNSREFSKFFMSRILEKFMLFSRILEIASKLAKIQIFTFQSAKMTTKNVQNVDSEWFELFETIFIHFLASFRNPEFQLINLAIFPWESIFKPKLYFRDFYREKPLKSMINLIKTIKRPKIM